MLNRYLITFENSVGTIYSHLCISDSRRNAVISASDYLKQEISDINDYVVILVNDQTEEVSTDVLANNYLIKFVNDNGRIREIVFKSSCLDNAVEIACEHVKNVFPDPENYMFFSAETQAERKLFNSNIKGIK